MRREGGGKGEEVSRVGKREDRLEEERRGYDRLGEESREDRIGYERIEEERRREQSRPEQSNREHRS